MSCFRRLAPLVPGAQAVVYDTALRGVHHQVLLRELGLAPVNKVTAAERGASTPRRGKTCERSTPPRRYAGAPAYRARGVVVPCFETRKSGVVLSRRVGTCGRLMAPSVKGDLEQERERLAVARLAS